MPRLSPVLKQATPVTAVRGEGLYLYDAEGRRHLDFTSGVGVTSTGHCHPRVVEAVREQAYYWSTASTRPSCTNRCSP